MNKHPDEERVQELGCLALPNLDMHDDDIAEKIESPGGMEAVVDVMKRQPGEVFKRRVHDVKVLAIATDTWVWITAIENRISECSLLAVRIKTAKDQQYNSAANTLGPMLSHFFLNLTTRH